MWLNNKIGTKIWVVSWKSTIWASSCSAEIAERLLHFCCVIVERNGSLLTPAWRNFILQSQLLEGILQEIFGKNVSVNWYSRATFGEDSAEMYLKRASDSFLNQQHINIVHCCYRTSLEFGLSHDIPNKQLGALSCMKQFAADRFA